MFMVSTCSEKTEIQRYQLPKRNMGGISEGGVGQAK